LAAKRILAISRTLLISTAFWLAKVSDSVIGDLPFSLRPTVE
jgi:hypothetical protein